MGGKLQPLRLPARESGERLPQANVLQTHRAQRLKPVADLRGILKKIPCLGHRQLQNLTDIAPAVAYFEDLLAETASLALAARSVNIREKLHFDLFKSLAAAGLAPAPFDVERKGGGGITPQAREVGGGKETPDGVEDLHVGCRVGAGSCPDRRLVNEDHIGNLIDSIDAGALRDGGGRRFFKLLQITENYLIHQARFS